MGQNRIVKKTQAGQKLADLVAGDALYVNGEVVGRVDKDGLLPELRQDVKLYPDSPTRGARYLVPTHWTVDELVSFLQLPPEECVTPWPMVKQEETLKIGESYNHVVMNQTEQKQLTKADAIILQRWLGDVMANRLALGTFGYRLNGTQMQDADDIKQMSGIVMQTDAPGKYLTGAEDSVVEHKSPHGTMEMPTPLYEEMRKGNVTEAQIRSAASVIEADEDGGIEDVMADQASIKFNPDGTLRAPPAAAVAPEAAASLASLTPAAAAAAADAGDDDDDDDDDDGDAY
jgi:hypothetical protein